MNINLLGIDLAKNSFSLHAVDDRGNEVLKKKLTRGKLTAFIANLPICTVVMEACGGANHWARLFETYGHKVKLISPNYVKPFVMTNKNDAADAQAICVAASQPHMRFVSPKTLEQQDIQSLHRERALLVKMRTMLVNQIRGLLAEYGIVIAQQIQNIGKHLPGILEDAENELTVQARALFERLREDFSHYNERVKECDKQIKILYRDSEACQRIGQIEGVGELSATAIVSLVTDVNGFKNSRDFSAWLGLVPKQNSTGGKTMLQGISKHGNKYLRTLLIHGARSAISSAYTAKTKRGQWISQVRARSGFNKATVAWANKNARIIWALLTREDSYRNPVIV